MDGRSGTKRNNNGSEVIQSKNRQEIVESYNHIRYEKIRRNDIDCNNHSSNQNSDERNTNKKCKN